MKEDSAWGRLNRSIEGINDNSYRRTVPVDPQFLSDALEARSYASWAQSEDNPQAWYERV